MFTWGSHSNVFWLISPSFVLRLQNFGRPRQTTFLWSNHVAQPSDAFNLARQSTTSPSLSFDLSTRSHLQKCSTYLKYFSLKIKLPTFVIKTTAMLYPLKGDWEVFSSRPHEPRIAQKCVGRGKPCVLRGMHYRLNLQNATLNYCVHQSPKLEIPHIPLEIQHYAL